MNPRSLGPSPLLLPVGLPSGWSTCEASLLSFCLLNRRDLRGRICTSACARSTAADTAFVLNGTCVNLSAWSPSPCFCACSRACVRTSAVAAALFVWLHTSSFNGPHEYCLARSMSSTMRAVQSGFCCRPSAVDAASSLSQPRLHLPDTRWEL